MLPYFQDQFANAGSITHEAGRRVGQQIEAAIAQLASLIAATPDEIIITSGATESNNLALLGSCLHSRQKRRKIVSLVTEHKAVLDPLDRLAKQGFEVILLPVQPNTSDAPGCYMPELLADSVDDNTALVSIMLANNEIGVIQPMPEIAEICRRHGAMLHTDASQAVGRIPVDVDRLDVDLLSFSAHKFYGPKGIGGLFVRRRDRRVRLQPQIVGGGQQHNLRSGTLNTAGIIGMTAALQICSEALDADAHRISSLRNRLFHHLERELEYLSLNGPLLLEPPATAVDEFNIKSARLPGNLNCSFFPMEGQSLMLEAPELAVSSGSACTSAEPTPSHVLRAIGLSEEHARSSLRFGIGRFNTTAEIDTAAAWLVEAVRKLIRLL